MVKGGATSRRQGVRHLPYASVGGVVLDWGEGGNKEACSHVTSLIEWMQGL